MAEPIAPHIHYPQVKRADHLANCHNPHCQDPAHDEAKLNLTEKIASTPRAKRQLYWRRKNRSRSNRPRST